MDNPHENVPKEHIFHFQDGKKAHNLKDLYDVIKAMDAPQYRFHVDGQNNDFANWVEFVYENTEIAGDLRKAKSQKQTLEILGAVFGAYGPTDFADNPVEEKQLHEDPVKVDGPQQVIEMNDQKIETVSTDAPHKFVVREFLYGTIFGAAIVAILFLVLRSAGLIG